MCQALSIFISLKASRQCSKTAAPILPKGRGIHRHLTKVTQENLPSLAPTRGVEPPLEMSHFSAPLCIVVRDLNASLNDMQHSDSVILDFSLYHHINTKSACTPLHSLPSLV